MYQELLEQIPVVGKVAWVTGLLEEVKELAAVAGVEIVEVLHRGEGANWTVSSALKVH
jgi:hypothetical protein